MCVAFADLPSGPPRRATSLRPRCHSVWCGCTTPPSRLLSSDPTPASGKANACSSSRRSARNPSRSRPRASCATCSRAQTPERCRTAPPRHGSRAATPGPGSWKSAMPSPASRSTRSRSHSRGGRLELQRRARAHPRHAFGALLPALLTRLRDRRVHVHDPPPARGRRRRGHRALERNLVDGARHRAEARRHHRAPPRHRIRAGRRLCRQRDRSVACTARASARPGRRHPTSAPLATGDVMQADVAGTIRSRSGGSRCSSPAASAGSAPPCRARSRLPARLSLSPRVRLRNHRSCGAR